MDYPFSSYLYKDETLVVRELLEQLAWHDDDARAIHQNAASLVEKTRSQKSSGGQLEAFLQEFSLDTEEGLAMMCLAEALLRIPDSVTANALIKDKVVAANWLKKQGGDSKDWMTKAAGVGLAITRKTLESRLSNIGEPVIRVAMVRAMQMMGRQFVLGTSIEDALSHASIWEKRGYRMSYDMLGEGARERDAARRYFEMYAHSIDALSANNGQMKSCNSGVSVKLSALHPRYTYAQKNNCVPEVLASLRALCVKAAAANISLTVDAEEMDRLDLSIEIVEGILSDSDFVGWDGFGLAVQAYQKRALPLVKYLADKARECDRRIQIRLVKGAYWDSEIKHAQMHGFSEYPVFTRKCNTDLSYLACAQVMFENSDVIYPMFATHNAHTMASIYHCASKMGGDYEFQRLHGMGEGLYAAFLANYDAKVSVYAPVGPHKDLLPYLVRRLLENGANSSFVNQLLDQNLLAEGIVRDPIAEVREQDEGRHSLIPLPRDIFMPERYNSAGIDFNDPDSSSGVLNDIKIYQLQNKACSILSGKLLETTAVDLVEQSFSAALLGAARWNAENVEVRASIIERFGDVLEENFTELMAILVHEGGKTMPDACDEVREAVDFCRYYAMCGRKDFSSVGVLMQGYTGEENRLTLQGRGVFVCISPWNFPLAIFIGQIVAALMAGNAVIAKPASQTRVIAEFAVKLMLKAGVPEDVLHLLLGDGAYGSKIVAHKDVAGVVFTGSTATAKRIQATLVESNDKIVPLIAETGGQNAMIVDSSALPEQVVDDVLHSAFGSAGQRCSALRVLYVQDEVADRVIYLLKGAMQELVVGDPADISSDVGYVIDDAAREGLDDHVRYMDSHGSLLSQVVVADDLSDNARVFAPVAFEVADISVLKEEVFGPVLHVIRYKAEQLDNVIAQINRTGFGLTFGLHSRIQTRHKHISKAISAGNLYINRSMTGAVVGVQPFGGMGLSGTGPKAGGPYYLHAFAVEKVVSTDTTAMGGNTSLLSLDD